jgi:hypothetical protein
MLFQNCIMLEVEQEKGPEKYSSVSRCLVIITATKRDGFTTTRALPYT